MKLFIPILDNGLGLCTADWLIAFLHGFAGMDVNCPRIGDSHPGRARNRAAALFLQSDCTHLLFIDTDIIFTRRHIELLGETECPILAGIYPLKMLELKPCLQTLPGWKDTPTGGIIKIARAGTGFLRIRRDVFERLKTEGNRYTNHGREEWDFFPSGVKDKEWLSEDWFFCDNAREAGFDILCDTRIQLEHLGTISYPVREKVSRLKLCPPDLKPFIEEIWQGEYDCGLETPPKTILDVGGNVGGFSVWAGEKWPEAKITAFEPHPDNATLFRLNTTHINVELRQAALRGESGEADIALGVNSGEHSFHLFEKETPKIRVKCEAAGFVGSHELVKLDCEGSEAEVLRWLDLSKTRAVVLEYHGDKRRDEVRGILNNEFEESLCRVVGEQRGIMHFKRKKNTQ